MREGDFWFNQSQHDETEKTVFGNVGNFDGAAIVDLCLAHPACPRFLAMKLLKTFVCSEPKQELIEAVATRIRVHDFVMLPVLRELLSSQVFYDKANRRSLIKSPLDLVVGSLRALAATVKWPSIAKLLANLGQDVFEPPSVKGWEGGRLWINSSSILLRTNFATELASTEQLASLRNSVTEDADESSDFVVARLERLLMGSLAEKELRTSLVALHQVAEGTSLQKLRATIQLILSVPEYQLY